MSANFLKTLAGKILLIALGGLAGYGAIALTPQHAVLGLILSLLALWCLLVASWWRYGLKKPHSSYRKH